MDDGGWSCSVLGMTTTSHTNCTHPATKAARAACRKGMTDLGYATPSAYSTAPGRKELNEPVDYSSMTYAFETTECGRCAGNSAPGYIDGYAGIYGGVCFACNKSGQSKSKGLVLTRAGAAAKKAHDEWLQAHCMISARDLQPGMKFRPNAVDGWKTVVEIDAEPRFAGTYTIGSGDNAVTTEMWHVMIKTQRTSYGIGADSLVMRAPTDEERTALIAHIANRKGTILTPKN